jgi:hypothetical protein
MNVRFWQGTLGFGIALAILVFARTRGWVHDESFAALALIFGAWLKQPPEDVPGRRKSRPPTPKEGT